MMERRIGVFAVSSFLLAACLPADGQSVVSTHSGLVYFFEGAVFIDGQRLEQKFGKFPDIGEDRELRTEVGKAEVLLTPGVFLRVGENSAIRMLSNKLSDTRVELLRGSAIVESNESAPNTSATVSHKTWQVRVPAEGVYRIDAAPPQVRVYKGEALVSAGDKNDPVSIHDGQLLPLAAVLVPEEPALSVDSLTADPFKTWAMARSQAISSDNATAAGITDDPDLIAGTGDPLGVGGLSYFPPTGIPGVAVTNPYGLSFWSPFQSSLNTIYLPSYSYIYLYGRGWPSTIRYPILRPIGIGIRSPHYGIGTHPAYGVGTRPIYTPPHTTTPHVAAPHPVGHPPAHR